MRDKLDFIYRYCNSFVSPTEIEDILQGHPLVVEALVFGVKDPKVQEQVSAVVVLKPISSHMYPAVTEGDIAGFVNSRYVSLQKCQDSQRPVL